MRVENILLTILLLSSGFSNGFSSFKVMPIQEDGRIKPLDTFARNQLLRFYGKRSTGTDLSPIDWLFSISCII